MADGFLEERFKEAMLFNAAEQMAIAGCESRSFADHFYALGGQIRPA